jgi:hypothetical protein
MLAARALTAAPQTDPPTEVAFSRIIHGWTNYSTAFLATHDLSAPDDFATVACFYTPACDVQPVEFASIFIWDGPIGEPVNFGAFDFQVYFWSSLDAFTNSPKRGDMGTFTFTGATGGSTNVADAITRGGRPAWLLRFALTNAPVMLTNHHTCLVGVAARTSSSQAGDLFVPTSSHRGVSDVQAGGLVTGGWRYLVDAGGATIYDGQLATELIVQNLAEPPRLALERRDNGVLVSWPASAGCYALESSEELGETNWTGVSATPAVSNDWNILLLPAEQCRQWFRLRSGAAP